MLKIAIVIPCHGREKLAEKVIEYHKKIPYTFVIPVTQDIQPLGRKFNEGFKWIKKSNLKVDGAMIVGSDNIIHRQYFTWLRLNKPLYCELGECFYYNGETGEMCRTPGMQAGAGKYFSQEFLERCDYEPYVATLDRNVDNGPKRFLAPQYERKNLDEPWVIDIKGPESMWTYKHARDQRRTYDVDARESFDYYNQKIEDWEDLV